ncbi:MAG: prephenate dehydrogenase dimerization domain-containing protein, partial [Chitinophagaceae bacterium]
AGGFESTVRLAKSSPAMWAPIFLQNQAHILDVLAEHIHQLEQFRQCIKSNDSAALIALMNKANRIKRILSA